MNNIERDKFLTEAMGECWHEGIIEENLLYCTCGRTYSIGGKYFIAESITNKNRLKYACKNIDFSAWPGFGKLWEWVSKQEWLQYEFYENEKHSYKTNTCNDTIWSFDITLINPDKFADAVYEYLKRR